MRILTWNVNHRTKEVQIKVGLANALLELMPDVFVLTEFVPGSSRTDFYAELTKGGYSHYLISEHIRRQNTVFIGARVPIFKGDITGPPIIPAVPVNTLHALIPSIGLEILGVRLPLPIKNRYHMEWWEWILTVAAAKVDHPMVIVGDFNVDSHKARLPRWKRDEPIERLAQMGFNIGTPPTGFSYYPKEGWEKSCLDHAFVNRFFRVSKTEYVTSIGSHALAGSADSISDHAPLIIDIDMVNTGNTF